MKSVVERGRGVQYGAVSFGNRSESQGVPGNSGSDLARMAPFGVSIRCPGKR